MKETLTHELAHVYAYRWADEHWHGYYWGYIMICMGYEPSKLASFEKSNAVRRANELNKLSRFELLTCGNCKKEVMAELINYVYTCPDCGGTSLTEE
jgi:hypothetical protein